MQYACELTNIAFCRMFFPVFMKSKEYECKDSFSLNHF